MIQYRKAVLADLPELVRFRIAFMKEAMKISTDVNDSEITRSLTEYFSETLKDNSFIAWLALDQAQIVATSGVCFYLLPPSYKNLTGKIAYIMNMYTKPEYRKKGIASHLFELIILDAKTLGYQKLVLHATEAGRPLYRKYGFIETDDEMVLNIE